MCDSKKGAAKVKFSTGKPAMFLKKETDLEREKDIRSYLQKEGFSEELCDEYITKIGLVMPGKWVNS